MIKDSNERRGLYGWIAGNIEKRSQWFIIFILLITTALFFPLLSMKPSEIASDNPTNNNAVIWNDEIQETFQSEVYPIYFIVEANDGDILTQKSLYELYRNEQALKESNLSRFLYKRYNQIAGVVLEGVYSLADSINTALLMSSQGKIDLSNASDSQVKQAVYMVLNDPLTQGMEIELSVKASNTKGLEGIDLWTSPAISFLVESDNEKVKTEYPASIGEDYSDILALEHFGRDCQEILRGEQENFKLWGVYIDMNLEVADEGQISGVMLMIAIVLMLVIISFVFRSWLVTLLCGTGLGMLIIWLKGFSNLVGLNNSTVLDLIVPISILVLGIDYAIHALFRYREELEKGNPPHRAIGLSTYGVISALVLAMLTTIFAFGANASSGIESIVGFGIASSIAIISSFLILGLFIPAVVTWYDTWKNKGLARSIDKNITHSRGSLIGSLVSHTSNKWFLTLPVILIITGVAAWGWSNLETELDPKEVFDSKSDLVIGLDKLDEHVAQKAGEPAIIYIKGDFTQHEALDAIRRTTSEMDDDRNVARRISDGKPDVYAYLFDYLAAVIQNDYARQQIETAAGLSITDSDSDLIPDTQEQLLAVFDFIMEKGIPLDDNSMLYTPQHIRETFIHNSNGTVENAVLITIGVPGTREQTVVKESAIELQLDMDTAMKDISAITFYGLTGDAYVRDAQFDAITDSMNRSLLIAIVACLILLIVVFRSIRYAVITLVPVMLVACWLYGFMYITGFNLNMMTATIAAISIGVGIDFSIHFTERFRQELRNSLDKKAALVTTSRNTGMALFGTALSTATGFAVIAFAPMPMFSAFGLLTMIMIVLSFLMALFVLPSLLLLLTPSNK